MALVDAYDTRTGKKLPYLVPEHHFDHPIFGRHISRLPSQKQAGQKKSDTAAVVTVTEPGTPTTKTPAAGDKKE